MKKKNQARIGESTRLDDDASVIDIEDNDSEEEEEDIEKLEEEVIEIVNRVEASRSTLPQHLKSSLSSLLSLQRPSLSRLHPHNSSQQPSPSCGPGSIHGNSSTDLETNDGEQIPNEVKLLRDKISSNITAIPKVLKRMNECISRVDKLVSSNETIHPEFKRKKS